MVYPVLAGVVGNAGLPDTSIAQNPCAERREALWLGTFIPLLDSQEVKYDGRA